MKKEKYIVTFLIAVYALLIVIVWGRFLIITLKTQKPVSGSNIPTYSVGDLNQAITVLGKRQSLEYTEKPEIGSFQIGLDEPFK